MSKKLFLILIILGIIGVAVWFALLKPKPVPPPPKVVAIVVFKTPVTDGNVKGFKDGMAKIGYVEGKNVTYKEYVQYPPGEKDKIREEFRDAIKSNVDLIYTITSLAAPIALEETKAAQKAIPVVFAITDPNLLKSGAIQSLKSTGNNSTGVMSDFAEVAGKQVEILREVNPNLKKIGLPTDGFMVPVLPAPFMIAEFKRLAPSLGLEIVEYTTQVKPGPELTEELKRILADIKPGDIDVIVHLPGHFVQPSEKYEADAAKRLGILTIAPSHLEIGPEVGALLSYGENFDATGKQAAVIADKVLKGTKPQDIPVESPRVFTLAINLQTAKELGITIPESLIARADILFE